MKQEDKELIEKYLKQGFDKEYIKEKFRLMNKDPKIIDDYFHSRKSRRIRISIILIILLISISFLSYRFLQNRNQKIEQEKIFMESIEEKINSFNPYIVNTCETIMLQQNMTYVVCTIREDNKVVLHDNKLNCSLSNDNDIVDCDNIEFSTKFNPNDYLGLQVNLQKLDIPFDSYYTCFYSDFPLYETVYPNRYGETKAGIYHPSISCSPKYKKEDYHHWATSGYILNKKGEYIISRIYVFDGNLSETYNFKNNLDKGILLFELKGEIIE